MHVANFIGFVLTSSTIVQFVPTTQPDTAAQKVDLELIKSTFEGDHPAPKKSPLVPYTARVVNRSLLVAVFRVVVYKSAVV